MVGALESAGRATKRAIHGLSTVRLRSAIAPGRAFQFHAGMKSAYELAMERLEKAAPTKKLTESQKNAIAEIDSVSRAKIAEREVFLQGEIAKSQAAGKLDEVAELEAQLGRDLRRISREAEEKKEKIRASSGK